MTDTEYSIAAMDESLCASEPPGTPRAADFQDPDTATSLREFRRRFWDFIIYAMSLFLVFLLVYYNGMPILLLFTIPIVAWCRASLYSRVFWERHLYTHGIATVATVTSFSTDADGCGEWVHWTYLNGRIGNSNRDNLPPSTDIGDQFWVIYDPQDPSQVLRWAQFAPNGQLAIINK